MFLALIVISLVALSGFVLTYLFAEEETFLWRISAGNVVGAAVFGLIGFVVCCLFGLSLTTALIALIIALAPLALLAKNDFRGRFNADWTRAKGNLQGANLSKFLSFGYYAFFLVLFIFFFDRAMFETGKGILTGGSQNLGDLPFHLGAIFSFTDGGNFPPQNPSYAGATFSYPFVCDLLTAFLMKLGADVESAMFVQNVSWAFALLVILEKLAAKLTGSKLAGKIAPALLFFSGGLGFLWFYKDFAAQSKPFFDFLFNLPGNYTIRDQLFSWGNPLIVLFITQRSLLFGMPLTLIIVNRLWETLTFKKTDEKNETADADVEPLTVDRSLFPVFFAGLLAGTLPLIHFHSLIVLFIVTGFLFVFKPQKWREWMIFGAGVCLIAVPELAWSIQGSASHPSEFFGWKFGWDKADDENVIWFWLRNTGIFIPLVIAGIYFKIQDSRFKIQDSRFRIQDSKIRYLKLFYLPFLFCFVIANVYKFAPWQWDNIKILIYWFAGSLPFAAYALARAWEKNVVLKIAAAACFIILTAAGAIDVWRVVSKQVNYSVFDADGIKIAAQIKQKTAPDALFLNAPTYNTAIVLSGRRSLMRYSGHLSSYGIDYVPREEDVKKIYQGDATAALLMEKYGIEYVLISPEEFNNLSPNEDYFSRFPVVAESGQYKVYKVKNN